MSSSLNLGSISTRLRRIATLARESAARSFLSLSHYIDEYLLAEAYSRTRKDGAVGVDGQTAAEYGQALVSNLRALVDRFKSGRYRAPPVRRVYIPKGDGQSRPLGIPTFEDKVLQRGVSMILEAIYEQDFLPCSYGFRPGRSAHQALQALWEGLMSMGGGWVLEVDIRSFYDNVDHRHLRSFLAKRVRDGVIRRMIDKWLRAGVLEEGSVHHPKSGTPQGGVISPLLANIYLHEVVDRWFHDEVLPCLRGRAFLVRYADDMALVFAREDDARRVATVLPKRLARFGLSVHPEKTQLVNFRRPAGRGPRPRGERPGTFELLGFTHYWGRSRRGYQVVKRKTATRRMSRALSAIREWCRRHRHWSLGDQCRVLGAKLRGHYAYYGINGNFRALASFLRRVRRAWRYWLDRRSQNGRMTWKRFLRLEERYTFPRPRIVHSTV